MTKLLKSGVGLVALAWLLAACSAGPEDTLAADPVAGNQGSVDSLTGAGEADDPLAGGAGDVSGSAM